MTAGLCMDPTPSQSLFADDITVIGLISDNDESYYRAEVEHLAAWCADNNLLLNTSKTKELIVDFRKVKRETHDPIHINGMAVERVSSFKFLGTHISENLSWTANTSSLIKKAHQRLFFLEDTEEEPPVHCHPRQPFTADTFSSRQVFVLLSVAVGENWYDIFGSGTKLYVTDEQVVKPVFSWKRQKEDGPLEELPPAEGEQLELRESGRTAAILLIRQPESSTYKYRCYVQHEGGTVEAPTEQGDEGLVTVFSSDSASCGDAVKESRGAED
ncbi:hypothetical protein L3Q82_006012 [Scortum barcoo]|uniref:Uncharacterized protein n=1 Tax=Scortum barcoo TaxID=214431 RepID=A0ACB8X390_9TELE|nr:hypothetical protein L3Q82_006012 [Scortum barcoo]